MKLRFYVSILLALISTIGLAQDIIVLKENDIEVKSKVLEVTHDVVKYKKWENMDGPTYSLNVAAVSRIQYKNGSQDNFDSNKDKSVVKSGAESDNQRAAINTFPAAANYPKVALLNVPYFITDNKTVELETAESTRREEKSGIWGVFWVKSIAGMTSNVRLSRKNPIQFLIQLEDVSANPFSVCELFIYEVKAQREFVDTKKGMKGEIKQPGIALEYKKLNDTGLYLITPAKKLIIGEYFFNVLDENDVHAFSVTK